MKYYGQGAATPEYFSVADLLAHGDGRCNAWQLLFIDAVKVHGIFDLEVVAVVPLQWSDWPPTVTNPDTGTVYDLSRGFVVKAGAAQGTNGADALHHNFTNHAVVSYQRANGTYVIFDPSYGRPFPAATKVLAEEDWDIGALAARSVNYVSRVDPEDIIKKPVELLPPGQNVDFQYPEE